MRDRLKIFLESTGDGAAILRWDCGIEYLNPVLRKEFGEPAGRRCHEYFHDRSDRCPWCVNDRVRSGEWVRRELYFEKVAKHYDLLDAPLDDAGGGEEDPASKLVLFRDVTARVDEERTLRRRAEESRRLIDLAQEGIWVIDAKALTTFVNPRMAEMLGTTPEEMIGKPLFDYMDEREAETAREEMRRRQEGVAEQHDFEFRRRDGTRLYASLETSPIFDPDGSFAGALACVADIARRKEAEDALRRSERELRIRNRISEIFLSAPEEDIYGEVLQVVLGALESKYGLFGYIDEDGAMVCPTMSRDVWDACQVLEKSIVFPRAVWGGLWGRALLEKRTLCENSGPLRVPEGHIPLRRAMCVPIVHRELLLGIIVVADRDAEYGPEDVELLEGIASKVALILRSRIQVDRAHRARRRAEEALARLKLQVGAAGSFAGIVGRDPKMLDLFETIREVAGVDVPVLILGESGTGKELVAGAVHGEGPRREGPFVPVNCSALPETLLESELFGHVRGAFTGAIRDKKGRFELANGGTIFLDEIGELSPSIQVSLLRVLQEGTIERLGDEKTRKVDVRVISATNRDLRKMVAAGRFREDLFYRLCVVPITVPPLRERRSDVPLLAEHVLRQVCSETGKDVVLSPEVLDAFLSHDWPGNVRELQNAIYYAVVKSKGRELTMRDVPPGIAAAPQGADRPARKGRKRKLHAEQVDRVLRETRGNKLEAARVLGVSRATLYKFLQRL